LALCGSAGRKNGGRNGFTRQAAQEKQMNNLYSETFKELPMEFAGEAQKLLSVSLEGSVG
jgi:Fe-S cluster assembly protein SufB